MFQTYETRTNRAQVLSIVACLTCTVWAQDNNVLQGAGDRQILNRVALLIGNQQYDKENELEGPVAEIKALAKVLEELDFKLVIVEPNLKRGDMFEVLKEFKRKVGPGDLVLFYYTGHGMQVNNTNYLLPTDFVGDSDDDVVAYAMSATHVLNQLRKTGAKVRVMVLDACRNNRFKRDKSSGSDGLATIVPTSGDLIAYSTGPNQTARDVKEGTFGLYMTHLLPELSRETVELRTAFENAKNAVKIAADQHGIQQDPWIHGNLYGGRLYLKGGPDSTDTTQTLAERWAEIRDTNHPEDIKTFLQLCERSGDNGNLRYFVTEAKDRFETLAINRWDEIDESNNPDEIKSFIHVYTWPRDEDETLLIVDVAKKHIEKLKNKRLAKKMQEIWPHIENRDDVDILERFIRMYDKVAGADAALIRERAASRLKELSASHAVAQLIQRMEFVQVPAGDFQMGCVTRKRCFWNEESPVHRVTLRVFEISKYEVTFEEYDLFTDATGRDRVADEGWGRGRRPVINVSWHDVVAYTNWLSESTGGIYRLPSEAEWEYAARAGKEMIYSWGNEMEGNRANCRDCGSRWDEMLKTAPVGSFEDTDWGLHDIHGNVWEWVQDCWNETYDSAPADGSAWENDNCTKRIGRGGSWNYRTIDVRFANRGKFPEDTKRNDIGFRVVRTVTR